MYVHPLSAAVNLTLNLFWLTVKKQNPNRTFSAFSSSVSVILHIHFLQLKSHFFHLLQHCFFSCQETKKHC